MALRYRIIQSGQTKHYKIQIKEWFWHDFGTDHMDRDGQFWTETMWFEKFENAKIEAEAYMTKLYVAGIAKDKRDKVVYDSVYGAYE